MRKDMTLIERAAAAVASMRSGWQITAAGERPVTLSEAEVDELGEDTTGYRRLNGARQDLPGYDQLRMQKVALHLYRNNHMAKRMLEIIVDFVLGDGLRVVAKHDDDKTKDLIQEVLDRFWNDPINDMDRLNPQRLLELNLWGEAILPVKVNELTGDIELGWVDPSQIVEIEPDPRTQRPAFIKLTDSAAKEVGQQKLEVIRFSREAGTLVGDCFFAQINHVLTARRGISEFYTGADWFEIVDETMKVQADRAKVALSHFFDVTLDDADDGDIKKFRRAQGPPKPGTMKVHNDKVHWNVMQPNLGAYEASRHLKDVKSHLMGGHGYPEHWFGTGGETSLATAEQMSEPTKKALKRKTRQFTYLITDICRFAIVRAHANPNGMLAGIDVDPMGDLFDVIVPDISGPDVAKVGSAMQTMTQAISQAMSDQLCSTETGRALFSAVASMTGVTVDPAEEATKIEADEAARAADKAQSETEMSALMSKTLAGIEKKAADKPDLPAPNPMSGDIATSPE
jgi:hypothetical protein